MWAVIHCKMNLWPTKLHRSWVILVSVFIQRSILLKFWMLESNCVGWNSSSYPTQVAWVSCPFYQQNRDGNGSHVMELGCQCYGPWEPILIVLAKSWQLLVHFEPDKSQVCFTGDWCCRMLMLNFYNIMNEQFNKLRWKSWKRHTALEFEISVYLP